MASKVASNGMPLVPGVNPNLEKKRAREGEVPPSSADEVLAWLTKRIEGGDLGKMEKPTRDALLAVFKENDVDGETLKALSKEDLRDEFKLNITRESTLPVHSHQQHFSARFTDPGETRLKERLPPLLQNARSS